MSKHGTKQKAPSFFSRIGRGIAAFFTTNRPSKGKAIALTAVVGVFGLLFVTLASVMLQFSYNQSSNLNDLTDEELGIDTGKDSGKSTDIVNIALFGVDSRSSKSFSGNSDSIMVISIDNLHNKIKITSFMRDSLVEIDGYRPYKLNSAYAKSATVAIKTLNQNFGLNIRDYATVNFVGMADIIDAVGGIEVDISERERVEANKHIKSASKEVGTDYDRIEESGLQTLTGAQAVAFARIRKVSTADGVSDDFGRTDRQRYVLEQLFNKALKLEPTKYMELAKTILKYVETSLELQEIIDLAGILTRKPTFEQTRVPMAEYVISPGFTVRGGSTVYFNLEYAEKILNAFIYDDILPEDYIKQNGVDLSGWYDNSGDYREPVRTTTTTTEATDPPDTNSTDYEESNGEYSSEESDDTSREESGEYSSEESGFDESGDTSYEESGGEFPDVSGDTSTDVSGDTTTATGDPSGTTSSTGVGGETSADTAPTSTVPSPQPSDPEPSASETPATEAGELIA